MLAFRLGDYPAARRRYEESLDAYRAAGSLAGVVATLYRLGEMSEAQGEYEEARRWLEESLTAARQTGDMKAVAQALAGLGTAAEDLGDDGVALPLYQESLALMCSLGARSENIALLVKMGRVAQRTGDPTAASLQEEALAISREQGDRGGVALALNGLGFSRLAEGDLRAAKALFLEALSIGRELCDERSVAYSLHHCGVVARACGELTEAGTMLREALEKQWALRDRRGAGASLRELGFVAQAAGNERRAVRLWAAGSTLPDVGGNRRTPREQAAFARSAEDARQRLGDALYTEDWETGRAWSWEAAVHFALREPAPSEMSAAWHSNPSVHR
jgi:tetratricopeptide (TPR) repeat protein